MRIVLLLCASGCARGVWNQRNVDCEGAGGLYIEAAELEVTTREPDPGDVCTLALRGLKGSDLDRDDNLVEVYDVGEVVLQIEGPRPPTELVWTEGADVDVQLDAMSIQLDTTDEPGTGQILYRNDQTVIDVLVEGEGHLDQLQIRSVGDVRVHLPPGVDYHFVVDGPYDPGELGADPSGPLVLIDTDGDVQFED